MLYHLSDLSLKKKNWRQEQQHPRTPSEQRFIDHSSNLSSLSLNYTNIQKRESLRQQKQPFCTAYMFLVTRHKSWAFPWFSLHLITFPMLLPSLLWFFPSLLPIWTLQFKAADQARKKHLAPFEIKDWDHDWKQTLKKQTSEQKVTWLQKDRKIRMKWSHRVQTTQINWENTWNQGCWITAFSRKTNCSFRT